MSPRKRLGEIVIEAGIITPEILESALRLQRTNGKRLGRILEEMGVVSEGDIATALARQFGFRVVEDFAKYRFPPDLLKLIPKETAQEKMVFPLKQQDKTLFVAMADPLDKTTQDSLAFLTGHRIIPCVTTGSSLQTAITRHYYGGVEQKSTRGWKILVVEDQALPRAAVVAALEKEGFSPLQAANGVEGMQAVHQFRPHLVLLDTVMPQMDGLEMYKMLQNRDATADIPVIGLSSRGTPEEEAKLLALGFIDFIPKPINPVRLIARVRRALHLIYGKEIPV